MPKHLVIVESPAKAKTIKKFLGDDYEIKASFGHVRDLPDYTLGVDLKDHFSPKYANLKDKQKVIKELKTFSKKSDIVYIATDPDREGEAIAWHIQQALELEEAKLQRVVFNEITEKAVKEAVASPRTINMDLVDAQQARRILDRLIGYKLSPILAKKIKRGLSAGRVQSVAVKMICDREKEILAFVPEEYWVIEADLFGNPKSKKLSAKLFAMESEQNKLALPNETEARTAESDLQKAVYSVFSKKTSKQTRNPYPPFITSTLQQDASRKLNWSAKKTMLVAQQLYEGIDMNGEHVGLITYMRTDSTRISAESQQAAAAYIRSHFGEGYLPKEARAAKLGKGAQDAHEAIRPSYVDKTPDSIRSFLEADHYKLYSLIWERFLASQMAPALLELTQILVSAKASDKNYLLKATGHVVLFDGFTKVYSETKDHDETREEEGQLPQLEEGEALNLKTLETEQKFTQPPARFTEARLVKEMEEKGIGRPSTYAPTITTILDRGYIEKQKRTLFPTELGMLVNDKLEEFFSKIIETSYTASMENRLDEIMEGKHKWQDIVDELYEPFSGMLEDAKEHMEKVNTDKPSDQICDKCGKPMVIKSGRFGEFLACTGFPECKSTKSMQQPLEVPCPDCGSAILERRSKRGKLFYGCSSFPKCKFASWDKPVNQSCPTCNRGIMFAKVRHGQEDIYCSVCNAPAKNDSADKE